MRFRAHETFFIRKGWLYKGMNNVVKEPFVFQGAAGNPMDILGIGANMVKSLRYWLVATGLTTEPKVGKRNQTLTELGKIIFENDAYMEETGSLCLIHYMLAKNLNDASSWYIFFNEFNKSEFNSDDFQSAVIKYVKSNSDMAIPNERTINDDFNCIINTYISRSKLNTGNVNPENNIDCPLGELGLISIVDRKNDIYRKSAPKIEMMPLLILLAIIIDMSDGKKEILISSIQNDVCNIGKVFNLDSIEMINILYQMEFLGYIKVIRTAGLDIIQLETDMTFTECIQAYYDELS